MANFKLEEETANVTMDLAEKLEAFCKSGMQSFPQKVQEFSQELVRKYSIPEISYSPPENALKHGFDFCDGCQKYTQQSLINGNWKCNRCERLCN